MCSCLGGVSATKSVEPEGRIGIIRQEELFVSEPDPRLFGNGRNPQPGTAEGWTNGNWLKSRFHFNFAEYRTGPGQFGVLRVMNDDLVQPDRGFGTHPHRDMEILTFVVEGFLTHKDSKGNEETLGRGSVQFMTAGTGIRHSEHNLHKKQHLRFVQCWVTPRQRGLAPNYDSMVGDAAAAEARKDRWAHIVSDVSGSSTTPVQINQDCNAFLAELSPNVSAPPFEISPGRQAYILCVEGGVEICSGKSIQRHGAAEVKGPYTFEPVATKEGAMLLMFEMAETRDGRVAR